MANAIDFLDSCAAKLERAQSTIQTTRKVAATAAGVATLAGLSILAYNVLTSEDEPAPPEEPK